ncbi:MAG: acyl-CoA thioesterase [Congregibacter sp.]|nr:acyl-CoA thioesterase [Congregibacter sp.]
MNDAWDHARPFLRRTRVATADVDALHHTNNTIYVRWCEECAWEHSKSLGMDIDAYHRLDRAMAVVEGHYRYLKASYLGDEIDTATWISHWDQRLTMTRQFQLRRVEDGITLLRAEVRFACIEISSGKPKRLPKEFIAAYGPAILNSD